MGGGSEGTVCARSSSSGCQRSRQCRLLSRSNEGDPSTQAHT